MFDRLPEYPWEQLKPFSAKAALHAGGAVDLSVGSPVDPTPSIIQDALNSSSNAPGYPSTGGTPEFKAAVVEWFARRRGVEGLKPEQVSEELLQPHLSMAYAPEPDLFIRTGGEQRVSNFLLWQLAYTELYFTDTLWPDFDEAELHKAFDWYGQRERRFGRTSAQLASQAMSDAV